MSYKDQATTANPVLHTMKYDDKTHTFAMWITDLSGSDEEYYEILKQGASDRGCDPDSMFGEKIIKHPTMDVWAAEAHFKEKANLEVLKEFLGDQLPREATSGPLTEKKNEDS